MQLRGSFFGTPRAMFASTSPFLIRVDFVWFVNGVTKSAYDFDLTKDN